MVTAKSDSNILQLPLPGLRSAHSRSRSATCCSVHIGQQVVYMGNIHGGPRFGAAGVVTEALQHKAVVDMGANGIWNVPYHFLTFPQAA